MFDGPVEVNLGNICDGCVPERFELELARVMKNVNDLNTDPEAARELVIKFKFKPSPDRKSAVVTMGMKCKLAALEPKAGSIFLRTQAGVTSVFTEDPRQTALFAREPAATPSAQ